MTLLVSPRCVCLTGDCCDSPPPIIGREGENIKIPCKHPVEVKTQIKHFRKQHEELIESDLISSKQFYEKNRYSMTHNRNGDGFTVTIQKLEKADAGTYWCGIGTEVEYIALTMKVTLQIAGEISVHLNKLA